LGFPQRVLDWRDGDLDLVEIGAGDHRCDLALGDLQVDNGTIADERDPFFVLSVKAGGTGLNLTAASHVIHFDRWWNPAVENQATDRAFRIGQNKNVLVHKDAEVG
jgi:hypothetical protein